LPTRVVFASPPPPVMDDPNPELQYTGGEDEELVSPPLPEASEPGEAWYDQ
jgi:hypothetical protein